MKYCHYCGYKLALSDQVFCPECGTNIREEKINNINIKDTKGDVIGIGISDLGNIIGKDIGYTVQGNVINLHITSDISNQTMEQFQKLFSTPTQLDPSSASGKKWIAKNIRPSQKILVKHLNNLSEY